MDVCEVLRAMKITSAHYHELLRALDEKGNGTVTLHVGSATEPIRKLEFLGRDGVKYTYGIHHRRVYLGQFAKVKAAVAQMSAELGARERRGVAAKKPFSSAIPKATERAIPEKSTGGLSFKSDLVAKPAPMRNAEDRARALAAIEATKVGQHAPVPPRIVEPSALATPSEPPPIIDLVPSVPEPPPCVSVIVGDADKRAVPLVEPEQPEVAGDPTPPALVMAGDHESWLSRYSLVIGVAVAVILLGVTEWLYSNTYFAG